MQEEKKRAVYLRVSTDEQDEDLQLKDLKDYVPEFEKAIILRDHGISAWKSETQHKREGYKQLLELIRKRKVQEVYVWDFDRLHRNRRRLVEFLSFAKAYGVKVYSYRQRFIEDVMNAPSPWDEIMSDLLINIMGWMAEEESRKISDRIRRALKKKGEKTVSVYGRKWGRKRIITNHKKAWILKYREQGMSIREIAKRLNVSKSSVQKILSEESLEKPAENTTSKKEVISGQ